MIFKVSKTVCKCFIYAKYSDRAVWANSVDPDQTPQNAASDQGLHCLTLIQHVLDTSQGGRMNIMNLL